MLAVAIVVVARATPASAGPVAPDVEWVATRGAVEPGVSVQYLLATDAAPGRNSDGALMTSTPVALPYRLSCTWRRLGPEAGRSMHVFIAGGTVLVKSGAVLLYAFDDASFANQAWTPVPGMLTTQQHAIAVTQTRASVTVEIDGTVVATYALHVALASTPVGFGMKGAPALRSEIYLDKLAVDGVDVRPENAGAAQ